jgi:tripartite-type tricarboxylate transporter receptor subunit TctC
MKERGWTKGRTLFLCGIFLFLIPAFLAAQPYPTRPINITIGFSPGGAVDPAVRGLAAATEKYLSQPFVLSNRGGGGGSIALSIVAKEKPDGYHLVGTSTSGIIYVPHFSEVSYKLDDFIPIVMFAKTPHIGLIVKSSSPWKTLKEFVEYAKKNPGAVNYGTSGVGSPQHLAMEYIAKQEHIQWTHVPYKGSSEAFMALLGGHITAQSGGIHEIQDHVKAGTVRILAVHGEQRMKNLPDVPALHEAGYNFSGEIYLVLETPKGTPPAIVKRLEEAFRKGTTDPNFIQVMEKMEIEITYRNSEDTKKYLEEAYGRLEQLVKDIKIPKEPASK